MTYQDTVNESHQQVQQHEQGNKSQVIQSNSIGAFSRYVNRSTSG